MGVLGRKKHFTFKTVDCRIQLRIVPRAIESVALCISMALMPVIMLFPKLAH